MSLANKIYRGFSSIVITNIKLLIKKSIFQNNIHFSCIHVICSDTKIEVEKTGHLRLGKMDNISKCTLIVRKNAILEIDDEVFMNTGVIVTCREKVTIGKGTLFGPNVLIFDHDHQINDCGVVEKKKFVTGSIVIGKNCWIGAATVILKDTVIGDNSIVGAGSILKGTYPPNSVIIQKRETVITPKNMD